MKENKQTHNKVKKSIFAKKNMKHIFTFFAMVILLGAFSACSSDDDSIEIENITTEKLLIGSWSFDPQPGYGDPTFTTDGKVKVDYREKDHSFSEYGRWTLNGKNLKIYWEDSDPGLEIYDTEIIEVTKTKLRWKVIIDGELGEESFTRK